MSPLFIYNLIFRYCSGGPPSSHLCISAMPCSDLRSSASFFIVRPPEMHSSPIGPSQPIKFLHHFATLGGQCTTIVHSWQKCCWPLDFFLFCSSTHVRWGSRLHFYCAEYIMHVQYTYIAWESDKKIIL